MARMNPIPQQSVIKLGLPPMQLAETTRHNGNFICTFLLNRSEFNLILMIANDT